MECRKHPHLHFESSLHPEKPSVPLQENETETVLILGNITVSRNRERTLLDNALQGRYFQQDAATRYSTQDNWDTLKQF
jgi:hypothetical protein